MVLVRSLRPIKYTVLVRALDAARNSLVDIDVLDATVVLEVLNVEIQGRHSDGLPREPTHALKTEDLVAVIAESLVLRQSSDMRDQETAKSMTSPL